MNLKRAFLLKVLLLILLLFALSVFTYLLGTETISVQPVSRGIASLVCGTQHLFGVQCAADASMILYNNLRIIVTPLCTGIDQMMFVAVLLFTYFGFRNRKTTIEIAVLLLLVLFVNYLRLLLFYPLVQKVGVSSAVRTYVFSYEYVQGLVLVGVAIAYIVYKLHLPTPPASRTRTRRQRKKA